MLLDTGRVFEQYPPYPLACPSQHSSGIVSIFPFDSLMSSSDGASNRIDEQFLIFIPVKNFMLPFLMMEKLLGIVVEKEHVEEEMDTKYKFNF